MVRIGEFQYDRAQISDRQCLMAETIHQGLTECCLQANTPASRALSRRCDGGERMTRMSSTSPGSKESTTLVEAQTIFLASLVRGFECADSGESSILSETQTTSLALLGRVCKFADSRESSRDTRSMVL